MNQDLRVEHAMEAVKYRVYPETPFEEVVDLMVRRDIHAVPVVGEGYEVLGIITAGDALAQVLREEPGGAARWEPRGPSLTARDVMSRSILCVSEDELLAEAAKTMVNRHVEQLPVVRDSELVGFLTREGLLRALHADGAWKSEGDE